MSTFIGFLPYLLLLLAGRAVCRPTHAPRGLPIRTDDLQNQIGFTDPEIVHIESGVSLLGIVMTEHCTIAFTPILTDDGQPAVQVVKNCTFEPVGNVTNSSSPQTTSVTITSGSPTATSTSANPSTTSSATQNPLSISNNTASIPISPTVTSPSVSTTASVNTTASSSVTTSATLPVTSLFTPSATDLSSDTPTSSSSSNASPTASSPTPNSSPPPNNGSPMSFTSTPQSQVSSTVTSTSFLPAMTPPSNNVAVTPQQSSALPKIIGAFAGFAVLLLIVVGSMGYVKLRKLNKQAEPIHWSVRD